MTLASRPQQLAIAMVGFCVLLLGLLEAVVVWDAALGTRFDALAQTGLGLIYAAMGTFAWLRRPSNRFGALLIMGGLVWFAAGAFFTGIPVLIAVSLILASTPAAIVVHLLHAFPSGRLRGPSRPIVAATYFTCLVLQIPGYLFVRYPAPFDVLYIGENDFFFTWGYRVQSTAGLAVCAATAVVMFFRLRALDGIRRRVMAPLFAYGLVTVLLQPLAVHVLPRLGVSLWNVFLIQLTTLGLLPVAFVVCLLAGGFGRTTEVQELGVWLGAGTTSRSGLRRALIATLGDPALELWFWVRGGYVDGEGHPVVARTGDDWGLVEVDLAGAHIGAISYDATLLTDRKPVESAGRVIALALDRERLTAELLAVRASLRSTLARVVESGDQERRRIARDLHDGLQSRLVLLGMGAYQISRDPSLSKSVVDAMESLRVDLEATVDELRRTVAGVMNATLLERGLYAATEDFVAAVPLRTTLTLPGVRDQLPSAIESAAYFVVTEAVTNVLKHAHADSVSVDLDRAGDRLLIAVADNGVGGVPSSVRRGGLSGLADRIGALGGSLEVESVAGVGTRLLAEVPCAS